uniref:Uncharacterized protein n=1 Tax=Manihot esculenta TaxID=3983 RepID=A0A2C9VVI9_MANES
MFQSFCLSTFFISMRGKDSWTYNNMSPFWGYIHTTVVQLPFYCHVVRVQPYPSAKLRIYNEEYSICVDCNWLVPSAKQSCVLTDFNFP